MVGGSTGFLATLRWLYGSTAVAFSNGITGPTTLPGLAGFFTENNIILDWWCLQNIIFIRRNYHLWESFEELGRFHLEGLD